MAKRYLATITKEEALTKVLSSVQPLTREELIPVPSAGGRMLSRPVTARLSNPPFTCSAMDGYSVAFEKTLEADTVRPVALLKDKEAIRVNTGDPLPGGTNAVIMVEEVEEKGERLLIRKPAYLWQNVRMIGEDVVEGDLLLPPNCAVRLFDIGLLMASGIQHVWVRSKPAMLIVPTGKELYDPFRQPGDSLKHGQLIDFNTYTLSAMAEQMGFKVTMAPIARDKHDLRGIIEESVEKYDIIIINAGSSAGTEDFTEEIIESLGQVLFHGVSMMPGKPVLFGTVKGKPVFGIPGYPVSAAISFRTFLQPVSERMTSITRTPTMVEAVAAYPIPSALGIEEVVRINLIGKEKAYYAFVLPRGASLFSSLAKADALISVARNVEGYGEGERISCELLRDEEEINRRICIAGSHDLSLDVLRDLANRRRPGTDLLSLSVGSLSGLMALKRGIIDLCTTHILDEEKKIYNIPAVERWLAGKRVAVVHIARRLQGLVVAQGNPKRIKGLEDLTRGDVTFVNRQSGSGTRILLDSLLSEKRVDPMSIRGYEREETTHTAVGIVVKEGMADAGMAVHPVARLFSLDFISLAEEEYDFVMTREFMETEKFTFLMDILKSKEFRDRLAELGGYSTAETGTIKHVTG